MIIGIGTDVFDSRRVVPIIDDKNDPFFQRAFTRRERDGAMCSNDSLRYFTLVFAGKEAVYKSIGALGCEFRAQDIEIVDVGYKPPAVFVHGKTARALSAFAGTDVEFHLSLAFESSHATAFALAFAPDS